MAEITNTYLGKNMATSAGFDFLAAAPLDLRDTVPNLNGLDELIANGAVYEGMVVYVESTQTNYQYLPTGVDGALQFSEFAGGVDEDTLNELIANATMAAMEFKGTTESLPTGDNNKGDMYKVIGAGFNVLAENDGQGIGFDAKLGDSIVYDSDNKWYLIPSGDEQSISEGEVDSKIEAIQGNTTNTIRDCVDAINKMNNIVDSTGAAVGETISTVENIVAQLTWGEF